MLVPIILLLLALFFSDIVFISLLLILGGGFLLVYKNPVRYRKKLSSYLLHIFVIFSSIFMIVVVIEVYLHLAQPAFLELEKSIAGDLSDFQSWGNVDEKTFTKAPGTFRILGLGDSFAVFAYDLQKNYHNYLTAALKAGGFNHVEVVNAGLPGVGPGNYWHVLEKFGDAWKPDLVLVGFFVGNDFEEMDFLCHRGPFIREPRDPGRRWRGYLQFRNFWVYQVIKGKSTLILEKRRKSREKEETGGAPEGTFSRQAFLNMERKRMWIFEKSKQADLDRLWQNKASTLLKFKEWCAQRQAPLVIAIFPDQFQVDGDLRQEIYRTYHLAAEAIDLTYPHRLISDYCRQHDILCLDLLPFFQEQGASRTLYSLRDSHWNETGNRLAGDLIFNYLTANGLIRPRQLTGAAGAP